MSAKTIVKYRELRTKKYKYRQTPCCKNCARCFIKSDYDDPNTYFCTFDAPKRPPCGSLGMGEHYEMKFTKSGKHYTKEWEKESTRRYEAWNRWSDRCEVRSDFMCDKYEKRKDEVSSL